MPLARSYIEGILLGEKIKGLRRQRESEELTDEILRERIKAYRKKDPFEEINLALKEKELAAEPKPLTGEAGWRQEHPGSTHEDYLRATKGISAEFKEEKVPWILKERTKELLITEPRRHKKEIKSWVTKFNKAWTDYQEENVVKGGSEQRRKFWNKWRGNIPAGDRIKVARQLGIIQQMPKGFGEPRKTKKEKGEPQNRQDVLKLFKAGGYNRISNRKALKSDYNWLTDRDIDWIEDNL